MSSKLWQMFTVRLSADVKPPDFPSGVGFPLTTFQWLLMCPPASLWTGSLTLRREGRLNIPQPGCKVVLLWKCVTFKKISARPACPTGSANRGRKPLLSCVLLFHSSLYFENSILGTAPWTRESLLAKPLSDWITLMFGPGLSSLDAAGDPNQHDDFHCYFFF